MTKVEYPSWGSWRIKTSWYAIGHSSKVHLFAFENKMICGLRVQPGFGAKITYHDFFKDKDKCKRCLKSVKSQGGR